MMVVASERPTSIKVVLPKNGSQLEYGQPLTLELFININLKLAQKWCRNVDGHSEPFMQVRYLAHMSNFTLKINYCN